MGKAVATQIYRLFFQNPNPMLTLIWVGTICNYGVSFPMWDANIVDSSKLCGPDSLAYEMRNKSFCLKYS